MHLTLLIADLIPPTGFCPAPLPPALDALIQRARVVASPAAALEEALLSSLGFDPVHAPIAALTRLADFPDHSEGNWLRADPVHLALSRDNVQLWDSHVLAPTAAEMAAI